MLFKPLHVRPALAWPWSSVTKSFTMPLRAKITSSAFTGQMQTAPTVPQTQPEDEADDVLFSSSYGVRTIELNRPKKLNSLNGSMVRKIIPRLQEWEKSGMANVIIMKGAGEKALCAGGDVAVLARWNQEGPDGQRRSKDYFGEEYKLDHLIATYSKPYIAFMDGITMGGGVGLSVHAPFRIATERTVFAMPETTIGFFPEVGGSFFLPRMDGSMGKYLALTSERLKGANVFYHGVATHYLHSSALPDLENRLAELTFRDYASLDSRYKIINSTIEEFVTGLPHDEPMQIVGDVRKAIDESFAFDDIKQILDALEKLQKDSGSEITDWARKTRNTILDRSPTSVKVTLKEMQLGKSWTIDEAFRREYHIAAIFMEHHDFVEGVSARLIRKEAPMWQPATLDDIDWNETDRFFLLPEGEEQLELLNQGASSSYVKYPHAWIGLPTEEAVKLVVEEGGRSQNQILHHFLKESGGKLGVKEKVQEILARKAVTEDGTLTWNDIPGNNAANTQGRGSRDPTRRSCDEQSD